MKLQSKIRSIFSNELLDLLASVCDTKRIPSAQKKMKLVGDLLHTYDIKWGLLGGATNRFVMFAGGYAFKTALDNQGHRDNFVEYSLCEELQPYVTKSYETNGYMLVAECVRTLTEPEFIARKQDILNILRVISDDYLLGDVGYLKKNFTNWGVRDNGELVILDYAYIHRATESLFTCPICGEGILTYDHVFDKLMCTNKTVCHGKFTYENIKTIQGDQVDLDMIEERKKISIALSENQTYAEVEDPKKKGRFITKDGKTIVIVDNDELYCRMMEAKNNMISQKFSTPEAMDALVNLVLANSTVDSVAKETAAQNFNDLLVTDGDEEVEYVLDPDYESERIGRVVDSQLTVHGPYDNEPAAQDNDTEGFEPDLDDLVASVMTTNGTTEPEEVTPLNDYDESSVDLSNVDLSHWSALAGWKAIAEESSTVLEDEVEMSGTVVIMPGTDLNLSNTLSIHYANGEPDTKETTSEYGTDITSDSSIGVVLDGVPL